MSSLVVVYIGFAVLAPLMEVLQRLWPAPEERPEIGLRARRLDWAYWLFSFRCTDTVLAGSPIRLTLASWRTRTSGRRESRSGDGAATLRRPSRAGSASPRAHFGGGLGRWAPSPRRSFVS